MSAALSPTARCAASGVEDSDPRSRRRRYGEECRALDWLSHKRAQGPAGPEREAVAREAVLDAAEREVREGPSRALPPYEQWVSVIGAARMLVAARRISRAEGREIKKLWRPPAAMPRGPKSPAPRFPPPPAPERPRKTSAGRLRALARLVPREDASVSPLRRARWAHGWTQVELARRARVTPKQVSEAETGLAGLQSVVWPRLWAVLERP